MVEGKESVLYALPFCAGTVTGIFVCGQENFYSSRIFITAAGSMLAGLAMASATILCLLKRKALLKDILACSAIFFCGIFCWSNHMLIAIAADDGSYGNVGIAGKATAPAAEWLKTGIDSLPLEDYGHNALIKALVTGDQSDVPPPVKAAFRNSGASHILALSGMHLAIIYLILTKMLSVLGQSGKADITRFAIITGSTLFYSVMTGSSPSIIRAFLFILLRETAVLSGRKARPVNILCFALTVQCAINPEVVTSASFQLSYLAMCGIYFLYPTLRDIYPANVAFTGPLAWVLFGSAPVYFIITNLIAVPLTSALIPMALAAVFLDSFGMCPGFLAGGIDLCCMAVIRSLEIICSLP